MLSIDAQIKELEAVALKQGLNVVDVFHESRSAKSPGRPVFNDLMDQLKKSEDTGILCWKTDRLARNPADMSNLILTLEEGDIKEIVTPHRRYKNTSEDKMMLAFELIFAKKYSDDLSDNVKRGNRAKLDKGILPGRAPLGYLNDEEERTIVKDPDRFHLVRKIWDVILSGNYNVDELLRTAEEDWGLTTRPSKKKCGKVLTRSALYQMLARPFYYGAILRNGVLYPGSHEPMITKQEFDQVQKMLRRPIAKRAPRNFAYTGMIKCGECGGMITAEERVNYKGYRYVYYHCTKRKDGHANRCKQKHLRVEKLEEQIQLFLESIYLPEQHVAWALEQIRSVKKDEQKLHEKAVNSVKKAIGVHETKLRSLLDLRLKELIDDDEYKQQKTDITAKKIGLEEKLTEMESNPMIWFEPSERLLLFLTLAKENFTKGQDGLKREILETIGSKLILKDKKLLITARKPFRLIAENAGSPLGWGLLDRVRTFFADPSRHFHIPVLKR